MKNLVVLFGMLLLMFVACTDECKDLACDFGHCDDGTCICDEGYEGSSCNTEIRDKYIGTWIIVRTCEGEGTEDSEITITKGRTLVNTIDIILEDELLTAVVTKTNFVINSTNIYDYHVIGNGSVSDSGKLKVSTVFTSDHEEVKCVFTGNK